MLLEVRDLNVAYNKTLVLKGLSINVEHGDRVAIVGPNGAGKSTLLKAIAGVLKPIGGEILLEGKSIVGLDPRQLIDQAVVFIPQGKRVFPSLSVSENIEVMLGKYSRRERERLKDDVYSLFPILKTRSGVLAGRLSGGEQQVVALARALTVKPKLLLLDEPSHGLSPRWADQIFERVECLQGVAVVLVEQNVRKALTLANRGYVIKMGQVARVGTATDLAEGLNVDWGLTANLSTEIALTEETGKG